MVYLAGGLVERRQCDDHSILGFRLHHAAVEIHDVLRCYLVHAYIFKDMQKLLVVILSIHLLKFNLHHAHVFYGIGFIEEELVGLIDVVHQFPFCSMSHYWRQLKHVANEDYLFASEGQCVAQSLAQRVVDGIHYVASHH